MLYCQRDCADDILATLRLDETKATYDEVRTALNGYFNCVTSPLPQATPVGWRVSGHIHPRFIQAEDCVYGSLKDPLIRNRFA